jgi:LPXTG-site transpeptidase (sortase) family protein
VKKIWATLYSGLFEYSNMPGEGDRNVSIAGHRSRGVFCDLDKPGEGDRAHLVYGANIYTYVFLDRNVVPPTDWSVITNQGFSCCTLVTCTPIRVADKRMIVRFELEKIEPYSASKIKEYAGEAP